MRKISYELLKKGDPEIKTLEEYTLNPDINRYISIPSDFFSYATTTKNVYFYKIKLGDELIGGLHLEVNEKTVYLILCINPTYQHQGYGTIIINDVIKNKFKLNYKIIDVWVDYMNRAALGLFTKCGFEKYDGDENNYEFIKKI